MQRIRPVFVYVSLLLFMVLPWTAPAHSASMYAAPAAPQALNKPDDISCRPVDNKTDQVIVRWTDTNNGASDYKVYRRATNANSWTLLDTVQPASCNGDDVCSYKDVNASASTVYRYRVDADDGNQQAQQSDICREPLWVDSGGGNYRTFYRLQECPNVDGKQVCTQNIVVDGKNKHAAQMNDTHEEYRDEFMGLGFNDPSTFKGGKPFPIDLYPCNNGCANSSGIQIPPDNLEGADYNPATGTGTSYEVFVVGHEAFHKVQGTHGGGGADPYYKWLIEGQARSSEDKSCIFSSQAACDLWDNQDLKYYASQVRSYLGKPEQALLEASYSAALFWTYVTEQFGASTAEPQRGMDFMLKYWETNEDNVGNNDAKDGIDTLNDALAALQPPTPRRFKDIFQDFAVANYAKDYITVPVPGALAKYNYIDEETYPGNSYGKVKTTVTGPLSLDDSIFGITSVDAWGARYFEVDPDPSVPLVNIEVEALAATQHELYFHVLAIDNGSIVDQWTDSGTSFELSLPNINPTYDRIALIVAAMGQPVNFNYGFNLTDGLFILSPTTQFPAAVGEATSPKKFILQLQVLAEDGTPVAGIDTSQFTITVDSQVISPPANIADDPIVGSSYIAGQYWLVVRAPDNPGCDPCDLAVAYTAAYSDTQTAALDYGPVPDVDNMVIIDRSGSMGGTKIDAAKEAARLYVDSYSTGDRVGVLSFNDGQKEEYGLTGWTNQTRQDAQTAINNMDPPAGMTAIGAALRAGQQALIDQTSPNPAWAMVLLSDGKDTVADTDDHIPAFLSEYKKRVDNGDQAPVMHVVAIGDDADGVALESVAARGNGLFQWLPEPSTLAAAGADATSAIDSEFYGTLSEIYRVFAEDVLDEQQIYARRVISTELRPFVATIPVDKAASEAIFVVKFYPSNAKAPFIALTQPGGGPPIPPTLESVGQRLWRLPAPESGDWMLTLRGTSTGPDVYLVEAALVSDLILEGFLGLPPEERIMGKAMPVLAHLSDIDPLLDSTVTALSERTGEFVTLFDDGLHGDGEKDDGFYGGLIKNTNVAGGYSIIIDAKGTSPFAGPYTRRARLSFYLAGADDDDGDRIPTWWEQEYPCMDPKKEDAGGDIDVDELNNFQEYRNKTNPCDPDTDDGGEADGSEVSRKADPLYAPDDNAKEPPRVHAWPGVKRVVLRYSPGSNVDVYRAPSPEGPFSLVAEDVGDSGEWVDNTVDNGMKYCYLLMARGRTPSGPSAPTCTIPKLDPNPPHGVLIIAKNALKTPSASVELLLDASDIAEEEEHPAYDGALLTPDAQQSGVADMKISNRADFEGAKWKPFKPSIVWQLEPDADGRATVFVMFRDRAGNESDVTADSVIVDPNALPSPDLYLPLLRR